MPTFRATRSTDNGRTWSSMQVVRTESGPGLPFTVIGNAAPVQLREPNHNANRILLPHTQNNSIVWLTHSDDDGQTVSFMTICLPLPHSKSHYLSLQWSTPRLLPNTTRPDWNWIGVGPPGSIQLRQDPFAGRIVVPIYHGPNRGKLANNKVWEM